MPDTAIAYLVNVVELSALLEDDPGSGVARRRLLLEGSFDDPQVGRLGRSLSAARESVGAALPDDAVAVLRNAVGWATLRLELDPPVHVLLASSGDGAVALRIEDGGWFTLHFATDSPPVDLAAIAEATGALFEVVEGPLSGTGVGWRGERSARKAADAWAPVNSQMTADDLLDSIAAFTVRSRAV